MDKHSHIMLSMDHPNIFNFIRLPNHKLKHMFEKLDYQNIHLSRYKSMHAKMDLHILINFGDIGQHKVLFDYQQKNLQGKF